MFCFFAIAVLKLIFPANVGVHFINGWPVGMTAQFPLSPGADLRGGYRIIPVALFSGLLIFVGARRGARKFLSWWRERRLS